MHRQPVVAGECPGFEYFNARRQFTGSFVFSNFMFVAAQVGFLVGHLRQ